MIIRLFDLQKFSQNDKIPRGIGYYLPPGSFYRRCERIFVILYLLKQE